jgi:hypothetical protein
MNVAKRDLSTKYDLTSGITASIHKPQRVNLFITFEEYSVPGQLVFHVRCARLQDVIL